MLIRNMEFLSVLQLSFSPGQHDSEDQTLCAQQHGVCLLAAFDGCGGAGSRRYPSLSNHTGAYLASRLYASKLQHYFAENGASFPGKSISKELHSVFSDAANAFPAASQADNAPSITGSMLHILPSTTAIAFLRRRKVTFCWAGNTRGYLLLTDGLHQATQDDLCSRGDAFDSLYLDAPMSNCICADRPFTLHESTLSLPAQGIVVIATDGAFHSLPTPMHFEALLLDTLMQADSKAVWKHLLRQRLAACADDDVSLLLQPFGFQTYKSIRRSFQARCSHVHQTYIVPADQARNDKDALRTLYHRYQKELA